MKLVGEGVGLEDIILDRGGNLETRFEAHCAVPVGSEVSDQLPFPEPPVTEKLLKSRIRDLERRRKS